MVKNSSFLRKKSSTIFCEDSANFFAILRIWTSKKRSEAKANPPRFSAKRSEAVRFAFAFFRNKANSQCEFTALVEIKFDEASSFLRFSSQKEFQMISLRFLPASFLFLLLEK